MVRAIRGATIVIQNDKQEILDATGNLLNSMIEQNKILKEDIISVIFSVTSDLNATFPATAARNLGWTDIALMCTYEIDVPGSLRKCIRVMMYFNTEKNNSELKFIYLKDAKKLRPDLIDNCQETEDN